MKRIVTAIVSFITAGLIGSAMLTSTSGQHNNSSLNRAPRAHVAHLANPIWDDLKS